MRRRTAPVLLAALLVLTLVPAARAEVSSLGAAVPGSVGLEDFDLLSPNEGWILLDQNLYWTSTGGARWDDVTPSSLGNQIIAEVAFLNSQRGWLVLTGIDDTGFPTYTLARTIDDGTTWDTIPLNLFQPGDVSAFAGDIHLHFLDAQTGWLVIERATSSNFSAGALFHTTDGGATWTERTIPIGAPVVFITPEVGWTAGGPAGDELYRTTDGGRTWQPQSVGDARFYRLPAFTDAQTGVLPAVATTESGTRIEQYETDDGGQTWHLSSSLPTDGPVDPAALPLAVVATDRTVLAAPGDGHVLRLSGANRSNAIVTQEAPSIADLEMVSADAGWALSTSGHYELSNDYDTALAPLRSCSLETQLLATSDGGHTWSPLALPRDVGDRTTIIQGHGFDKCEVATLPQLQNWISNSPYDAVNLYIGGACRSCANSALSASYLSQMSQQGWRFIPTWVGPQSACWSLHCGSEISNDTTTAYQQGINEANAAIDRAIELGLAAPDGSGTIIYYDIEYYDTSNTACREAAQAFISGWTARLHALGSESGVYSNGPPLSTFASIDNVPDAVWPAHWLYSAYNPNATVWNVYSLSNDLWSNHQRIRQYAGGHNETWGGVTLNIDSNVIDGVVATMGGDATPPTKASNVRPAGWTGPYTADTTPRFQWNPGSDGDSGMAGYYVAVDDWTPEGGGTWDWWAENVTAYTVPQALTEGEHTVAVTSKDNAGNVNPANTDQEGDAPYTTFYVDVSPPTAPQISVSGPGCAGVQNNVWQNTCRDPSFAWRASDSVSGVEDYRTYWGDSPSGVPEIVTTDPSFDPAAVAPANGTASAYLNVTARDALGHESGVSTFGVRYDGTVPTVTLSINNGAETTNQVNVRLNLSSGDTGSGVFDVRISNNGLTWSDWQPYSDVIPWTLPALDRRELPVYVQVRDHAGNESVIASDTITLDLYPPTPHSANYRICQDVINVGGSIGITSTSYSLISAIGQPWGTGADANASASFNEHAGFLSSLSGCLPITRTSTSNYTVTQSVIASGGNLRGSASFRLGDTTGQPAASGNSAFSSTNYVLSSGFWSGITGTVPPTSTQPTPVPITPTPSPTPSPTPTPQPTTFGITINDGALFTNNPLVTVRLWGPNVTQMRLSNDGGFVESYWQSYCLTTTWMLSVTHSSPMPRLVYVQFQDGSGDVYGTYFDDIIYDDVAPTGEVHAWAIDETTTEVWLPAHDDVSGVAEMRIADNVSMGDATWEAYTETVTRTTQSPVVYAQFRDRAGNSSSIYGSDGQEWERVRQLYLPLVLRGGSAQ